MNDLADVEFGGVLRRSGMGMACASCRKTAHIDLDFLVNIDEVVGKQLQHGAGPALKGAMAQLPEDQRTVVQLYDLEGRSAAIS